MSLCYDAYNLKWNPYFMRSGEGYYKFWNKYLLGEKRDLLYILGKGFDYRMCNGLETILNIGGTGKRDCMLIDFDEGVDSPSRKYAKQLEDNYTKLNKIILGKGNIMSTIVKMWTDDGLVKRRITSRSSSNTINDYTKIGSYSDIIIDVSSLPRSIYFTLISKIIYLIDNAKRRGIKITPNLHIIVSEDARYDKKVRAIGIDDTADYIHGFRGDIEMDSAIEIPIIWIPVLGENKLIQLQKIYEFIKPKNGSPLEICPVLPSPSSNPRRDDDLLIEYHELLFDQWNIEPKNIIYAHEQNPFDVYRQIYRTVVYYNKALKPLGQCKSVISAESSKLISLGALLSVYELKEKGISVSLAHIEPKGYDVGVDSGIIDRTNNLFTIMLVGSCYE